MESFRLVYPFWSGHWTECFSPHSEAQRFRPALNTVYRNSHLLIHPRKDADRRPLPSQQPFKMHQSPPLPYMPVPIHTFKLLLNLPNRGFSCTSTFFFGGIVYPISFLWVAAVLSVVSTCFQVWVYTLVSINLYQYVFCQLHLFILQSEAPLPVMNACRSACSDSLVSNCCLQAQMSLQESLHANNNCTIYITLLEYCMKKNLYGDR